MNYPNYFSEKTLQVGFTINLDSHKINHKTSILTFQPNFPALKIEFRYNDKIPREIASMYARLINQYIFKYHTILSARYDKHYEEGEMMDEIELYMNLNIKYNSTESDIEYFNVRFQLREKNQRQEFKKVNGFLIM